MKVVNKYKQSYTVYIGRPSIFGNPYSIGKDGNREEVINLYRSYVRTNPTLLKINLFFAKRYNIGLFLLSEKMSWRHNCRIV